MIDTYDPLLKQVSRSFYLTVRILPRQVRRPIGLAYLLARATDTIADTDLLPADQRLDILQQTGEAIQGTRGGIEIGIPDDCIQNQSDSGERLLLEQLNGIVKILMHQPREELDLIQKVLKTIVSGQTLDLDRFKSSSNDHIIALKDESELDDYTYRVAGCVGEFWTRICSLRLYSGNPTWEESKMIEQGVKFGQGLQLVNIMRDLPSDLEIGRCYLPETELAKASLKPADLMTPTRESDFIPIYVRYIAKARNALMEGWSYTCALPGRPVRLKLACAWPILIGLKTLNRLEETKILSTHSKIKITRSEIRKIMLQSICLLPFKKSWEVLPSKIGCIH